MPTIVDYGGKGAALSGAEYDTNLTLPVTAVTTDPFTVMGVHNRDTLELKSGANVVNLSAYATLIAEDTGDFEVTIKNRSGSSATISANGVETFDGVDADIIIQDGDAVKLKAGSVAGDFMVTQAHPGIATTTLTFSSVAGPGQGTAQNWVHGLGTDDIDVGCSIKTTTGSLSIASIAANMLGANGYITIGGYALYATSINNPASSAHVPASGNIRVNVYNGTSTTTDITVNMWARAR